MRQKTLKMGPDLRKFQQKTQQKQKKNPFKSAIIFWGRKILKMGKVSEVGLYTPSKIIRVPTPGAVPCMGQSSPSLLFWQPNCAKSGFFLFLFFFGRGWAISAIWSHMFTLDTRPPLTNPASAPEDCRCVSALQKHMVLLTNPIFSASKCGLKGPNKEGKILKIPQLFICHFFWRYLQQAYGGHLV